MKTCEGLFGCKEYKDVQVPCGSVATLCGEKVLCNCNDTNSGDFDLEEHGMDSEIVKYLEENLAWTNEEEGVAFCAYNLLGEVDNSFYLKAHCEEYYRQDEKIFCPDEKTKEDCFMAKDKERKACKDKCDIKKVNSYLSTGGGVSIPVKVTKEENGFSLWQPRDGNLYSKDLQANFPKKIFDKLDDVDGGLLQSIIIERAEKHFDTKVTFKVSGDMDRACSSYLDCGMVPFDYAIRSNCPHTVKCLDNKCVAGCYDFFDYTRFPLLKKYTWQEIVTLVNQGEVKEVFQSHALDVELIFKDGTRISTKEPKIDEIFKVIDECGEKCEDVIKGTE